MSFPKYFEVFCVLDCDAKIIVIRKIKVRRSVRCIIDEDGQKYPRIDPANINASNPYMAELTIKSGIRSGFNKRYRLYPIDCQTIIEQYEAQEEKRAINDFRGDFLGKAFDQLKNMNYEQLKAIADILAQDKFKTE